MKNGIIQKDGKSYIEAKVVMREAKNPQVSRRGDIYLATHDSSTKYPLRYCEEIPNTPTSYRKECVKQDLYFLSGEELKKGDYIYDVQKRIGVIVSKSEHSEYLVKYGSDTYTMYRIEMKKIIATTDKSLSTFPQMYTRAS